MPSDSVNEPAAPPVPDELMREQVEETQFYRFGDNQELCRFPSGSWSLRYLINGDPSHIRYLDEHEQRMVEAVRSSHPESREQGETKAVPTLKYRMAAKFDYGERVYEGEMPAETAPSSARAELVESVTNHIADRVRTLSELPHNSEGFVKEKELREIVTQELATAPSAREGEIYDECAKICRDQDADFHRRYGTYEPAVLCERAILSARSKNNV